MMSNVTHNQQSDQPAGDLPRGIGNPARRALALHGYERLDQLTSVSEAELKQMHGVGSKAIGVLREALAAQSLSFADDAPQRQQ